MMIPMYGALSLSSLIEYFPIKIPIYVIEKLQLENNKNDSKYLFVIAINPSPTEKLSILTLKASKNILKIFDIMFFFSFFLSINIIIAKYKKMIEIINFELTLMTFNNVVPNFKPKNGIIKCIIPIVNGIKNIFEFDSLFVPKLIAIEKASILRATPIKKILNIDPLF